jgi:hypothetical protein
MILSVLKSRFFFFFSVAARGLWASLLATAVYDNFGSWPEPI